MTETRYLVYKTWNGRLHSSIEYGEHSTGTDKEKEKSGEVARFKIDNETLEEALRLHPYEVKE